mmetsp:Transcript_29834/g.64603  ORF Transcript_29834/g.64603 Transcript_29834/m.64603 type:complete len:110 (+) Transcript_29834:656-985(+)
MVVTPGDADKGEPPPSRACRFILSGSVRSGSLLVASVDGDGAAVRLHVVGPARYDRTSTTKRAYDRTTTRKGLHVQWHDDEERPVRWYGDHYQEESEKSVSLFVCFSWY